MYYQSFCAKFKKPIKGVFRLSDDKQVVFEIDNYTIDRLLTNKEGEIDEDLVKTFSSMYAYQSLKMRDENSKEISYYKDLLSKERYRQENKPDTEESAALELFLTENIKRGSKHEFEMLRGYVSKLTGQAKIKEIEDILDALKGRQDWLLQDAYMLTKKVFEMSEVQQGEYDFSDVEKKFALAERIQETIRNFDEFENEDFIFNQVIELCKDEDGKIDFFLANEALNTVMSTGRIKSLETIIKQLKYFFDKDPENRELTNSIMQELNCDFYMTNEANDDLCELMELCFDEDDSYNPIKAEVLSLANNYLGQWINSKLEDSKSKGETQEQSQRTFYIIRAISKDIILSYFKDAKDENGKFNPYGNNLANYIANKIKTMDFI